MPLKISDEQYERIIKRENFCCGKCGVAIGLNGAIAHRIRNGKAELRMYGKEIISHDFNLVYACKNNQCNDFFNIGFKPGKASRLVNLIREYGNAQLSAKDVTNYIFERIK